MVLPFNAASNVPNLEPVKTRRKLGSACDANASGLNCMASAALVLTEQVFLRKSRRVNTILVFQVI